MSSPATVSPLSAGRKRENNQLMISLQFRKSIRIMPTLKPPAPGSHPALPRRLIIDRPLEQQDMRFWLVDLVVLPAQALSDPDVAPLRLVQQLERAGGRVEQVLWDLLQHRFGKLDVSVFAEVVAVSTKVLSRGPDGGGERVDWGDGAVGEGVGRRG